MHAEDCDTYYEKSANGIVYGKEERTGRNEVVFVERGQRVDVVSGILRSWVDQGVSRCVRAVGVEEDWEVEQLRKIGEEKGRKVEGLEDEVNAGVVSPSLPIRRDSR